jgi:glycosyltransferase involved in cell wall biosynthesis
MAAGLPLVAGDNVGYQAVMSGRGALSLVNPQDTVDFARRLEIMLFDDELRALWQKWAHKHVRQFEFPKIAKQYLEVYEQALTRQKKPA